MKENSPVSILRTAALLKVKKYVEEPNGTVCLNFQSVLGDSHKNPIDFQSSKLLADKGDMEHAILVASILLNSSAEGNKKLNAKKYLVLASKTDKAELAQLAQLILGILSFTDNNESDDEDALKYFISSAQLGNLTAVFFCGCCKMLARGCEQNLFEAFRLFKICADKYDADCAFLAGICFEKGVGTVANLNQAMKYYRQAADQGNMTAQSKIGAYLLCGIAVQQDVYLALSYLILASEQGYAPAFMILGWYYYNLTDEISHSLAYKYYALATEYDLDESFYEVGNCYTKGCGVAVDYVLAFRYYKIAADRGIVEAQLRLGECYYYGTGTVVDYNCAFKCFVLSRNLPESLFYIAVCYQYGTGVDQNDSKALGFFELAHSQGFSAAKSKLDEYAMHKFELEKFKQNALSGQRRVSAPLNSFGHDRHTKISQGQNALSVLNVVSSIIAYSSVADATALYSVFRIQTVKTPANIVGGLIESHREIPSLEVLMDKRRLKFKHHFNRGAVVPCAKTDEFQLDCRVDNSVGILHTMHSDRVVYNPHQAISVENICRMHLKYDNNIVAIPSVYRAVEVQTSVLKAAKKFLNKRSRTYSIAVDPTEQIPDSPSTSPKGASSPDWKFTCNHQYVPLGTHKWNWTAGYVTSGRELLTATHYQNAEVVQILIDEGTFAGYTEADGIDAALIAAYYDNARILKILGVDGKQLSSSERSSLSTSMAANYKFLSSHSPGKTFSVHVCTKHSLINALSQLIVMGANVNAVNCQDETALQIACKTGNVRMMEVLLSYNAIIDTFDKKGRTALHLSKGWSWYKLISKPLSPMFNAAIRNNETASIKYLLSIGMDCDCDGNHILVQACHYSSDETVALILSLGVDVNSCNANGTTSLMWAAFTGRLGIIKLLLDAKADVALKDEFGWTALDYAKVDESAEICCLLSSNDSIMEVVESRIAKNAEDQREGKRKGAYDADEHITKLHKISFDKDVGNKNNEMSIVEATANINVNVEVMKASTDMDVEIENKPLIQKVSQMSIMDSHDPVHASLLSDSFKTKLSHDDALAAVIELIEYFAVQPSHFGSICPPDKLVLIETISLHSDFSVVNYRHPSSLSCLLHLLCQFNLFDAVQTLLVNPVIDVHARDGSLSTPLIIVTMTHQNLDMVQLLLDKGANVLHRNEKDYCSLHYAAMSANGELLNLLFSKASTAMKLPNVLHCLCNHSELQKIDAITNKRYDLMKFLLNTRKYLIDEIINDEGDTIQMYCCRHALVRFIDLTIELNANPEIENLKGETALKLSADLPWWESISQVSIDKLITALYSNDLLEIKRLINVGVQINRCNATKEFPLITAVKVSSDEVVSLMISLRADVNVCWKGVTPLLAAASKGYTSKIAMLIDNKADLNACDSAGNNLFHLLAVGGYIEGMKVGLYKTMKQDHDLLAKLVKARNNDGWTPVMVAAKSVSRECVDFLSAAGSELVDLDSVPKDKFLEQEVAAALKKAEAERAKLVDPTAPMDVVTTTTAASKPNSSGPGGPSSAGPSASESEVVAPPHEVPIQKMLVRSFVERLYHACKFGLTPVVLTLLSNEKNIHLFINSKVDETNYVMVKDKLTEVITSETCLYVACYYGHTEIVRELLGCKAEPNLVARNGWSCLFVASKKGYTDIVRMLIDHDADVNVKNRNDMTSLNIAAYGGYIDIVKMLVDKGADVNQGDKMGARPLHAAIQSGKYEVVDYLLDHGADVNGVTNTEIGPLYVASYSGNVDMVKRFLSYIPPPGSKELKHVDIDAMNREGLTAITVAAFNGHVSIVQLLLEAKADLNKTDKKRVTALYAACQNGFMDVVNLILSRGVDPNTPIGNKNTPVHAVAIENKYEILHVLIKHAALIDTMNVDGVTPLYMACEKGHLETLNILIEHGANVDTPNKHTVSPLNIASQNGHLKIVEKLIACHANVNSQTEDGPTPLFIAAQNGHTEICRVLLEAGAEVDTRTKEKETAIFVAGYFGYVEIVKLLIKFKASINIVDRDTRTPLWWACKAGQEEVVRLYMEAGADVNISDREHVTPMMIAAQQRKVAVCELLNAAKAQATLCAICLTNQRCCLFMPCKHLASCADCSLKLERSQSKMCPICRSAVTEVVTVFT